MKRKLTVTVTKIRRQTVLAQAHVLRSRCPVCQREVETVSQAEAAEMLMIVSRRLDDLLTCGELHDIPGLRVCKDSLLALSG